MDTKKYHIFIPKLNSKSEKNSLYLIKNGGNFRIPEKLTEFDEQYANDKKYTMSRFLKTRKSHKARKTRKSHKSHKARKARKSHKARKSKR